MKNKYLYCLLLCVTALSLSAQSRRPNVILIMTDDQGYGDLSCHGNPILATPNLDRLHDRSLRLTDYHVAPMCTPTRGQLMTGVDAARNGAINVSSGRTLLRPEYPTMAEIFAKNGYQTGLFGKWHLGDAFPYRPEDRGFQKTLWFPSSHIGSVPDFWGNDYFDDTYLEKNNQRRAFPGYCTDVFFENAMTWIASAAKQDRPFFTYLPLNAPHSPLNAPAEDLEAMKALFASSKAVADLNLHPGVREGLMRFLAMIRNIDTNVGRLLDFLQKNNLLDNTILIFTTDNGSTFGSQYYNAGMRGKKTELWEGGHRVPLFVSWPAGLKNKSGDIGGLAQAQDVLPTLIDLCKLRAEQTKFDGTSLAPALLRGTPLPDYRMLVIDYSRMSNFDFPSPASRSIVRREDSAVLWKRWRLLEGRELYDLSTDPMQETNVIDRYPEVAAKMRDHLDRWWREVAPGVNQPQPVVIGSNKASPTLLTACEWLDVFVDQQKQIVEGVRKNSYWNLNVSEPGTYRFELRRWPREADLALDEPEGDSGKLPIAKARIQVAGIDKEVEVRSGSKSANFTLQLPAGPTYLHTWFYDRADRPLCGAYYVYVEKE